ncbi:MAG: energy transducer TonB [Myxococcales bacterium]|jgi:protein TonB
MSRWARHLLASTTMLLGSAMVFGFIVLMNEYSTPPPKEEQKASTAFKVEKKKKPPPRRKKPKPKPRRAQRNAPKRAPTPNLSSAISDVAIDIPGFDGSQLGNLSDQVLGQTSKKMVMDENSVDEPPRPVNRVAPDEYPPKARKAGISGYVTMNLLIGTSGDVERVKVLDSEPVGIFEDVAVATIRRWRFQPAVYQAEHVRVWAKQTIRFKLN